MEQGGPPIFSSSHHKSYFFCEHAKFQNLTIIPSRRKVSVAEQRREKNAVNSGHKQNKKDFALMFSLDFLHWGL